jgi:hypothetical protein
MNVPQRVAIVAFVAGAACHAAPRGAPDVQASVLGAAPEGGAFELAFASVPVPIPTEGLQVGLRGQGDTEYLLPWELTRDGGRPGVIDRGDVLLVLVPEGEALRMAEQGRGLSLVLLVPAEAGHRELWAGGWSPFP